VPTTSETTSGDAGTSARSWARLPVTVAGLRFSPQAVVVAAGGEVTWVFSDGPVAHNVVFDDLRVLSPAIIQQAWSHRFDRPGTYRYRCSIHPFMTGTVTVT
jgi:plastocyanin